MLSKQIQLTKRKNASPARLMRSLQLELKEHMLTSISYEHPDIFFTPPLFLRTPNIGKNLAPISSGNISFDENNSILELHISYKSFIIVLLAITIFILLVVLLSQNPSEGLFFLIASLLLIWGFFFNIGRFFSMLTINNIIYKCAIRSGYKVNGKR